MASFNTEQPDHGQLAERLLDPVGGAAEVQSGPQLEPVGESIGEIIVDSLQSGAGSAPQTPEYRDKGFALAFVAHLLVVLGVALFGGHRVWRVQWSDSSSSVNWVGPLAMLFVTCLASVAIGAVCLEILMGHAEEMMQLSLVASCTLLGIVALVLWVNGAVWMALLLTLGLGLTVWYAYVVWHRIPFSASNLKTALAAIQSNYGVCILSYVTAIVANAWVLVLMLAFLGVSYTESCDKNSRVCRSLSIDPVSTALLILSYYWTSQVFKNIVAVSTAGVVGTFWFAPQDAGSLFSPAIQDSYRRATSYSFGSICMGSLLVAIIQSLEQLTDQARRRGGGGVILCTLECILFYLQRFAKYFNKWAFVYVGLYGYDYLTSGRKVLELFQGRGWVSIISDNLVHRTLMLVCVVVAGLTGLIGMLLAKTTSWAEPLLGAGDTGSMFFICCLIGLGLSSILMSVVESAVDTVIVSFAEAPAELETNHPVLAQQMMNTWRRVYPNECGF